MRSSLPRPWLVLALLSLSLGCGGGEDSGGGGGSGEVDPGFELHVLPPDAVTIMAGGDEPIFVAVTVPEGESAPTVYLRLEDLPDGVYAQTTSVPAESGQGTIWLQAEPDAVAASNVTVRIVGTSPGVDGEAETTFTLTVEGVGATDCDPGFGVGGIEGLDGLATARVGNTPAFRELVVLSDGSILAAGSRGDGRGWLAQWDPDGFPDPHFGTAGVRVFEGFSPQQVTVAGDGRIYLVGHSQDVGGLALARLAGTNLDLDFGYVPVGSGNVRAFQAFGSVLAVSIASPAGHTLVRLDLSGAEVFPPASGGPSPEVSRFAADGSLVAGAGTSVFRFDPDGDWDTDFAGDGSLAIPGLEVSALLPQGAAGNFLVGGMKAVGGRANAAVTRVAGDAIDPNFNADLSWRWEEASQAMVVDLVPFGAGAAALAYEHPTRLVDVVVFDSSGDPRPEYGIDGVFPLPFLAQSPMAHLAVDRGGHLLAGAVGGPDFIAICRIRQR